MSAVTEFLGTGRRKCAVARVRLAPGEGKITVNGRPIEEYFVLETQRTWATQPLALTGYTFLAKGGDLIVAVDGQAVVTFSDLTGYIYLHKSPGDTITLTILRGDQQLELPLVLGTRP